MAVSNWISVLELKKKYIEVINEAAEIKPEQLRLFCLGKEFKNELFLYNYDIVEEMIVQAMVKRN
jgi:hypothetical protein